MSTKFSQHSAYQSAGLDWLSELPAHWQTKKVRWLSREKKLKNDDLAETNVLSLSYGRIIPRNVETNFGLMPESFGTYQIVSPDDIVLRLTDLQNDKRSLRVGHVLERGIITSAYICLTPIFIWPRFVYWALHQCDASKLLYSLGGGVRQSIDYEDIRSIDLPLPPVEEQRAIASFLDRETAKIDALIEKKRRLIELLQEKRQSVISSAVTRGLNPTVPMKPSGDGWLGDIPKHWQLKPLGQVAAKITNGYVGPTRDILVQSGVPYLQSLHIKDNRIVFDGEYFVTQEWSNAHAKSVLAQGDVLIVQTGDIGQVAVVSENYVGANCHALIVAQPIKHLVSGEFLSWLLWSSYGLHSLLARRTGATHPHLNCGNIKDIAIPLPPVEEQHNIVREVELRSRHLSTTFVSARSAILMLEAYRTSLIAAAVTGKIDVRGTYKSLEVPLEAAQ